MKLIIENSDTNIDNFIYDYLPNYIHSLFTNSVNTKKLKLFDTKYKINSFNIISYLLKNITISKLNNTTFIFDINKNLKMNGEPLYVYLKYITYGDRTTKGYPIIYDIFKMVAQNINSIYIDYKRGE